jgi:hypothetical protein
LVIGEDAERLESAEHPAHTCACAITLAGQAVSRRSKVFYAVAAPLRFSTAKTRSGRCAIRKLRN